MKIELRIHVNASVLDESPIDNEQRRSATRKVPHQQYILKQGEIKRDKTCTSNPDNTASIGYASSVIERIVLSIELSKHKIFNT